MPLYKNDLVYDLSKSPQEIKDVEEFFHGKFPVKVVYPPERIIKSRLPHNRLPDQPNSISFDYRATVKTDKGLEVWRYAENIIVDNKGQKKYVPKKFLFDGTRYLKRNDIELIFFLLRKSEFCVGGDNFQGDAKFMFEDKYSEAERRAEKKKIEVRVDKMLYDDDSPLDEEKLRAIAGAYQVVNVETYSLSQVRNTLRDRIFSTPKGPQEFFLMVGDDEQIQARNSITKAMKMGVLKCDLEKGTWYWQSAGEDGAMTSVCKVPPTKTPNEAIYDYYLGNNTFREDLQAVLLTKNPEAGKKGKKEAVKEG
jgi:hypothetical protein